MMRSKELQTPSNRWLDDEDLKWAARHWAARVGVHVPQIQIRDMSSKWASMSTAGRLTLNSELTRMPKDIGEFVIVHEILHMIAPNHGQVFKSFLFAYLPDWQEREKRLRGYEKQYPNGKTRTG